MTASKMHAGAQTYHKDTIIDKDLLYYSTHNLNNTLSLPFIKLNSDEKIRLSFDYKGEYVDFNYKIIHCDSEWNKSDIDEFDYIDGFVENQVTEYDNSFNTNINYCHYNLDIPNQDVKLKKSGNYKIIVYKNYDEEDIVFTSSFCIVESLTNINGKVRSSTKPRYINTSQEIMLDINYSNLKLFNPNTDLKVYVWQNGDMWGKRKMKADFIKDNSISYKYSMKNIFSGGNEYRNFSTQNTRFLDKYVRNVKYNNNEILVNLFPTYSRFHKPYIYERDINGFYIVRTENKSDVNVESDYTTVAFTLAMDSPINKDIYVFGALSNWSISERFKMSYNIITRSYSLKALLKQGYYNYKYVLHDPHTGEVDKSFIEGTHYETENDYFVAVYFRDISKNYDRLVGYKHFNSSNSRVLNN